MTYVARKPRDAASSIAYTQRLFDYTHCIGVLRPRPNRSVLQKYRPNLRTLSIQTGLIIFRV